MGINALNTIADHHAEQAHRDLVRRLQRLRRKDTAGRVLFGVTLLLACGLGGGGALLLLEAGVYLRPLTKLFLEGLLGLLLAGIFVRFCLIPLLRSPSLETLALRVECRYSGFHQGLISALQLWKYVTGDGGGGSAEMIRAAVIQAGQRAADLDFDAIIDRARLFRMAGICCLAALVLGGLFGLWPQSFGGAAVRLRHPQTAYSRPPDTYIEVRPGHAEIVAGGPFEIVADLSGVVPQQAQLLIREEGVETWTSLNLPVRQNRVRHRFGAVTRSFAYRMQANDAGSPAYDLTVLPRPMVTQISLHYRYPAYTRLPERWHQDGGDIVAHAGTAVGVHIASSLPLEEAWLDFGNGERMPAAIEGRRAQVELRVDRDRRYTVGLLDPRMIRNRDPVTYRIIVLQDRAPEVRLLRPGADVELGERMQVLLMAEALDDFGISRMEVRYRSVEEEEERILPVPLDTINAAEVTQHYLWDLSDLDLLPGDEVSYRMRVYDNNDVSGPGVGESATFTIRFPSLLEIHQEAQRSQQEALEELEAVRQTGTELQKRLEKMTRELMQEGDLEWQERKEIEAAVEEQAQAGERLEAVMQRLNDTLDRFEQSGLIKPETFQKLEQIQELLSQIETPEFKRAQEELQKAMEAADAEAVQEALKALQNEQEAFQKSLDRTIALLKRVQRQQALDALARQMEALASEQEDVVQDLQKGEAPQGLAQREAILRRNAQHLQEEVDRTAQQLSDVAPTGEELDRLAEAFREQRVPDRMEQVGRDLNAGQAKPAQSQGQAIADDLKALSRQLGEIREGFANRQKADVARDLNRALHDLLALSRTQEHTARAQEASPDAAGSSRRALEQARVISGTTRLAERLLEASQKTFFLTPQTGAAVGEALRKMEDAAGLFQNGNIPQAARNAQEAMGALNAAALMVREALAGLAESASAVGFEEMLQKMQELAQQQGDLNAQTESLFGQQQKPGGMNLGQMAARQQAIRQALDALRQQLEAQRQQVLGDLGNIASEMEETAGDFRRQQITPQTLDRQRRILSRLMDAQRSVRQRGWSKAREARRGRDVAYRGPGSLPADLGEADNPLRRRLREALREGYAIEYQDLIRRYFEALMQDAVAGKQGN